MNRLDPQIKRLMHWANQAPSLPPPSIPQGFAARVVARQAAAGSGRTLVLWQRVLWGSAGAAAAIILFWAAMMTIQSIRPRSAYDFAPAYHLVSMELVP